MGDTWGCRDTQRLRVYMLSKCLGFVASGYASGEAGGLGVCIQRLGLSKAYVEGDNLSDSKSHE